MDRSAMIENNCNCNYNYIINQSHRYLLSIINGCLPCIRMYKMKIDLGPIIYRYHNICIDCKQIDNHDLNCQFDHRNHIYIDESKSTIKINPSGLHAAINLHITHDCDKQYVIDLLCDIKTKIPCVLSKLDIHKLFPLTYKQIESLIYVGYLPTTKFWAPYVKHHMKTLSKVKELLDTQNKKIKSPTYRLKQMSKTLSYLTEPLSTLKFNLYMLRKKKGLCYDASNIIESFIM